MSCGFEWSAQQYSVRDIIYNLPAQLPLIVRVTEGYCSNDYFHDFGTEQMMRVYDVARQERVVVREVGGRYLSIPVSYPVDVQITYNDRRVKNCVSMSTVANIIRKQPSSSFTLMLGNDKATQPLRHVGADCGRENEMMADFGVLQPVNVYFEPFLIAHTVVDGNLYTTNTFIPAYVNIAMSVAVGIKDGTQKDFGTVLCDFSSAADSCKNDCVVGKQEIIAFPHSPCESDYEFIVPVMHINVAQSDDWRTDYDGYLKSVPSFTREQQPEVDDDYEYCTPEPRTVPPSLHSLVRHRPQAQHSTPPIPVRAPTTWSTIATKTNVNTTPKVTLPTHCMAAVIADLKKFNVKDDSEQETSAARKLAVASMSSQPTLSRVSSFGSSGTSYTTPVHPLPMPHAPRPGNGRKQTLESMRVLLSTDVRDQNDDILTKDVSSLSTEEVSVCLTRLKIPEHVKEFVDKEVDGDMLCCLDESILIDDFRFSKFNAKKLMKFVNEGYIPRTKTLCPSDKSMK